MNNPKIERRSTRNIDRNYRLDPSLDSNYFDYFIKMAYYYTVYITNTYPNLSDEDKVTHIYYLLLNATSDYGLSYGDCLLKGLAINSFYTYIGNYKANDKSHKIDL